MSNFKEIVTKAVVGKGKKTTEDTHIIEDVTNPSTILGCWVINHNFSGVKENDSGWTGSAGEDVSKINEYFHDIKKNLL